MSLSSADIVAEFEKFKGDTYVYGAAGPTTFDCSGLVQYALTQLGVKNVPRTSEQQWAWVDKISKSQLQPGDLVFAQFPGDNASPGHVGVYLGNDQVLSAEDPASGVNTSSLSSWGNAVVGYGKVPDSTQSNVQTATLDSFNPLGGLLSFPSQITGFFSDADKFVTTLMWLVQPSSWMRIGAFLVGVALLLFAIHALIAVGSGKPVVSMPSVVPVPV